MRIFHTFKSSLVTVFADRHGSHSHRESLGADLAGISPISPDSGVQAQAVPVPKIAPRLPVRALGRVIRTAVARAGTAQEWGQPMTTEQRLDVARWAL